MINAKSIQTSETSRITTVLPISGPIQLISKMGWINPHPQRQLYEVELFWQFEPITSYPFPSDRDANHVISSNNGNDGDNEPRGLVIIMVAEIKKLICRKFMLAISSQMRIQRKLIMYQEKSLTSRLK